MTESRGGLALEGQRITPRMPLGRWVSGSMVVTCAGSAGTHGAGVPTGHRCSHHSPRSGDPYGLGVQEGVLQSTVTKAEAEGGFQSPLLGVQVYFPASSGVVRCSRRLPSTRTRTRAWRWLGRDGTALSGTVGTIPAALG